MSIITFVGSGQMASALAFTTIENGHEVRLVGSPLDDEIIDRLNEDDYHLTLKRRLPSGATYYKIDQLDKALENADIVVSGVSSFGVDWFRDNILPKINKETPILSVTKGMINQGDGSLQTYLDYYKEKGDYNLNAVGGPCTSYELADHDPSYVTFCGSDTKTLKQLKDNFSTNYYFISLDKDIDSVEYAVALKNAYALAVTLAVGLAEKRDGEGVLHYNSQAALFTQSVREMKKLMELAGADSDKADIGIGDLYVTIYGGRTRQIGTLLGKGYSFDDAMKELEGVTLESIVIAKRTAEAVKELAKAGKANLNDFPLLMHVNELISENKPVNIPWKSFEMENLDD